MRDFRTTQLIQMKKDLQNAVNIISSALEVRRSLIEYKGATDYEKCKDDAPYNPECYYYFKVLNKGCSIIRTKNYTDVNGLTVREKDYFYRLKTYGFYKGDVNVGVFHMKFDSSCEYGHYATLDEALIEYPRLVIATLEECFNWKIQDELALF